MTITIPQSDTREPGTWKATTIARSPAGHANLPALRGATIVCPKCGRPMAIGIGSDHGIGDDGTVCPSVVCPREGCGFHEFVQLEGWKEQA